MCNLSLKYHIQLCYVHCAVSCLLISSNSLNQASTSNKNISLRLKVDELKIFHLDAQIVLIIVHLIILYILLPHYVRYASYNVYNIYDNWIYIYIYIYI